MNSVNFDNVDTVRLGIKLAHLVRRHTEWSERVVGPKEQHGPIGPLKHLAREAQEAIEEPTKLDEYADCLLLVLDSSRRAGLSVEDLIDVALAKMSVIETRKYVRFGFDEPVEHMRELIGD